MAVNHFFDQFRFKLGIAESQLIHDAYDYLGPNYETVFNFWKFLSRKNYLSTPYKYYGGDELDKVYQLQELATSITSEQTAYAIWTAFPGHFLPAATYEIIAMHQILGAAGGSLIFVPQVDT